MIGFVVHFRRFAARLASCLLVLTMVSCRGRESAVTEGQPVSSTIASDSSSKSELVDEVLLSEVAIPSDTDPSREGWSSESIASHASIRLNELGHSVLSQTRKFEFTSPRFTCDQLIPQQRLAQVLDDELVIVKRLSLERPKSRSQHSLDDAMESIRHFLSDHPHEQKFKFKLFRIEVQPNARQFSTRQYVHFSGRSEQSAKEFNATWMVNWERADDTLRIRSIELEDFEQVTLRQRRQFSDLTKEVLANSPCYATALQPGIPHWRKQLEYSLGVYNFGHHGLSIGDANGDGLDDLYVCQTGGLPNHLFLQQADGTLRDASSAARVDYLDNTRSALFLDLDNDDDQDLVLALNSGLLFLENAGNATFQLKARIRSVRQAFSLASADFDQDGLLDLYICVYYGDGDDISQLPVPVPYFDAMNGGHNHLVRNLGNWKFDNVTENVGLDDDNSRFSFAATWEDYDSDGDPDLFVVNDFGPNHLYQNDGGRFRNVSQAAGLLDGAFGMSSSFGDYDRDGRMDLYVGNMFSAAGNRVTFQPQFKPSNTDAVKGRFQHLARGNSLFRNLGDRCFQDVSVAQGVTMGRWSWSSLFADINNDGWDDLLVGNGFVTGQSKDDL